MKLHLKTFTNHSEGDLDVKFVSYNNSPLAPDKKTFVVLFMANSDEVRKLMDIFTEEELESCKFYERKAILIPTYLIKTLELKQ